MPTDFPLKYPDGQRLEPTMVNADDAVLGDVLTVESDGVGGKRSNWVAGGNIARSTTSFTTAELAPSGQETGSFALFKSSVLIRAREVRNRQCRVRLYGTAAARDADVARAYTTTAISGSATTGTGIATDLVLGTAESFTITTDPKPILANTAVTPVTTIYYTVDNLTAGSVVFEIELTHKPLES
jgi:hypothetical protein